MLFRLPIDVLILLLPTLLFALCFHEYSHAWMAYKLGDPTAARNGRLSLNPMAHLDPVGSLMILFVGFGWAKPVPVDPRYFANPRTDMMKVAFAGPASNILLALISGLAIRFLNISQINPGQTVATLLYFFTYINIALAVFNMIPIPPLDGSQIFSNIMIQKYPQLVYKMQAYGPQILMGIIIFGMVTNFRILSFIMNPFISLFLAIFAGL
jgi:Zn-dependent protease